MATKHPVTQQVEMLARSVGTESALSNASALAERAIKKDLEHYPKAEHYGRLDALESELIDVRKASSGLAHDFVENVIQYLEALKKPLQGSQ